jgi:hypothetical protein
MFEELYVASCLTIQLPDDTGGRTYNNSKWFLARLTTASLFVNTQEAAQRGTEKRPRGKG